MAEHDEISFECVSCRHGLRDQSIDVRVHPLLPLPLCVLCLDPLCLKLKAKFPNVDMNEPESGMGVDAGDGDSSNLNAKKLKNNKKGGDVDSRASSHSGESESDTNSNESDAEEEGVFCSICGEEDCEDGELYMCDDGSKCNHLQCSSCIRNVGTEALLNATRDKDEIRCIMCTYQWNDNSTDIHSTLLDRLNSMNDTIHVKQCASEYAILKNFDPDDVDVTDDMDAEEEVEGAEQVIKLTKYQKLLLIVLNSIQHQVKLADDRVSAVDQMTSYAQISQSDKESINNVAVTNIDEPPEFAMLTALEQRAFIRSELVANGITGVSSSSSSQKQKGEDTSDNGSMNSDENSENDANSAHSNSFHNGVPLIEQKVDEEMCILLADCQRHFEILQRQEVLLQDELSVMNVDFRLYTGEYEDEYVLDTDTMLLHSSSSEAIRAADEAVNAFWTEESQSARAQAMMENHHYVEKIEEQPRYDSDGNDLLLALTDECEKDPDLEEFKDKRIGSHRYPPSFERVLPPLLLKAIVLATVTEKRPKLLKRYNVPDHMEIVLRKPEGNLGTAVYASMYNWSFASTVHPSVLKACFFGQPADLEVLGKHYQLSESLYAVKDCQDTDRWANATLTAFREKNRRKGVVDDESQGDDESLALYRDFVAAETQQKNKNFSKAQRKALSVAVTDDADFVEESNAFLKTSAGSNVTTRKAVKAHSSRLSKERQKVDKEKRVAKNKEAKEKRDKAKAAAGGTSSTTSGTSSARTSPNAMDNEKEAAVPGLVVKKAKKPISQSPSLSQVKIETATINDNSVDKGVNCLSMDVDNNAVGPTSLASAEIEGSEGAGDDHSSSSGSLRFSSQSGPDSVSKASSQAKDKKGKQNSAAGSIASFFFAKSSNKDQGGDNSLKGTSAVPSTQSSIQQHTVVDLTMSDDEMAPIVDKKSTSRPSSVVKKPIHTSALTLQSQSLSHVFFNLNSSSKDKDRDDAEEFIDSDDSSDDEDENLFASKTKKRKKIPHRTDGAGHRLSNAAQWSKLRSQADIYFPETNYSKEYLAEHSNSPDVGENIYVLNKEAILENMKKLASKRDNKEKHRDPEDCICLPTSMCLRLKPHQKEGVKFLWDKLFGSIDRIKHTILASRILRGATISYRLDALKKHGGCILAHSMGLGKTFTIISFVTTLLCSPALTQIEDTWIKYPLAIHDREAGAANNVSRSAAFFGPRAISSQNNQNSSNSSSNEVNTKDTPWYNEPMSYLNQKWDLPNEKKKRFLQCVLVLAPVSTLSNWEKEFKQWPPEDLRYMLNVRNMQKVETKGTKGDVFKNRLTYIKKWNKDGGVLLMGYEAFRLLAAKPEKPEFLERFPKLAKGQTNWPKDMVDTLKPAQKEAMRKWQQLQEQHKQIFPYLIDPGPDVVIADEGHKIKNKDTGLTKLVNQFQTLYRIALTGSPLQNNLEEYRVMIDWIRHGLLGNASKFKTEYMQVIAAGQMKDASEDDKRMMRKKTFMLHKRTEGVCVDRKNLSILTEQLPPKREFVVCLNISPFQRMLYIHFLTLLCNQVVDEMADSAKKPSLFAAHQCLLRIYNHPGVEVIQTKKDEEMMKAKKNNASNIDKGKPIHMWSHFGNDVKDHQKMSMTMITHELAPTLEFFHSNDELSQMLQAQYNAAHLRMQDALEQMAQRQGEDDQIRFMDRNAALNLAQQAQEQMDLDHELEAFAGGSPKGSQTEGGQKVQAFAGGSARHVSDFLDLSQPDYITDEEEEEDEHGDDDGDDDDSGDSAGSSDDMAREAKKARKQSSIASMSHDHSSSSINTTSSKAYPHVTSRPDPMQNDTPVNSQPSSNISSSSSKSPIKSEEIVPHPDGSGKFVEVLELNSESDDDGMDAMEGHIDNLSSISQHTLIDRSGSSNRTESVYNQSDASSGTQTSLVVEANEPLLPQQHNQTIPDTYLTSNNAIKTEVLQNDYSRGSDSTVSNDDHLASHVDNSSSNGDKKLSLELPFAVKHEIKAKNGDGMAIDGEEDHKEGILLAANEGEKETAGNDGVVKRAPSGCSHAIKAKLDELFQEKCLYSDWWRMQNERSVETDSSTYSPKDIIELGSKIPVMLRLMCDSINHGDKVLIFSHSLITLDLIEKILVDKMPFGCFVDLRPIPGVAGLRSREFGPFKKDRHYSRLDGKTLSTVRQGLIDKFNNTPELKVMLISTKAGGIGINLQSANRVILMDSSWNPAHDVQALHRVYRMGQTKNVFVYRLLAAGTMEEKIYKKQVIKQQTSARVVDNETPEEFFDGHEIAELLSYEIQTQHKYDKNTVTKVLAKEPSDKVLSDLFNNEKNRESIVYIEDQGLLLEDHEELALDDADKETAENEYRQEERRQAREQDLVEQMNEKMREAQERGLPVGPLGNPDSLAPLGIPGMGGPMVPSDVMNMMMGSVGGGRHLPPSMGHATQSRYFSRQSQNSQSNIASNDNHNRNKSINDVDVNDDSSTIACDCPFCHRQCPNLAQLKLHSQNCPARGRNGLLPLRQQQQAQLVGEGDELAPATPKSGLGGVGPWVPDSVMSIGSNGSSNATTSAHASPVAGIKGDETGMDVEDAEAFSPGLQAGLVSAGLMSPPENISP